MAPAQNKMQSEIYFSFLSNETCDRNCHSSSTLSPQYPDGRRGDRNVHKGEKLEMKIGQNENLFLPKQPLKTYSLNSQR